MNAHRIPYMCHVSYTSDGRTICFAIEAAIPKKSTPSCSDTPLYSYNLSTNLSGVTHVEQQRRLRFSPFPATCTSPDRISAFAAAELHHLGRLAILRCRLRSWLATQLGRRTMSVLLDLRGSRRR